MRRVMFALVVSSCKSQAPQQVRGLAPNSEKDNEMLDQTQEEVKLISSNASNWIIEDGFTKVEHGEYRISKGTIMFYDCASDEWVPTSVNYDGAPDPWGKLNKDDSVSEPSGHDWTEGNSVIVDEFIDDDGVKHNVYRNEFFDWSWKITDGWDEAHAIGLPGLYTMDKSWFYNNRLCQSCRIVTPKVNPECENCGYEVVVRVS